MDRPLCLARLQDDQGTFVASVLGDQAYPLSVAGSRQRLSDLLETDDPVAAVLSLQANAAPRPLAGLTWLAPIDRQEVWAAGVTYTRSKSARMEESEAAASCYDRVYVSPRPELFFKSLPEKVVGPGDRVGIRRDARWNVPEPELALVFNSRRQLVGVTIGNDMSSRDIEGENLRYLPQAKVYDRACALGPWIAVGATEKAIRSWTISLEIRRQGTVEFHGETPVARITRTFNSLGEWLFRSQTFAHGAVLLTGTGIVPPDDFTLEANDRSRSQSPASVC